MGAVAGGAIGVAVGMLLAPERGERSRRRVAYQLDHMASRVGNFLDRWGQGQEYSEARESGAEVVGEAKARAEQILKDANTLLDEVKRHKDIAEDVSDEGPPAGESSASTEH
jgi:gas vesicle protein